MNVLVRPEMPADRAAIYDLTARAFDQSLHDEAGLVDKLRESPSWVDGLSRVAEMDGNVVGHVLLTRAGLANVESDRKLLALGPLAVAPERQKQGIGSALMRDALDAAARLDFDGVALLGHSAYYPRFGFAPASRWGLRNTFDVTGAAWMARPLRPNGLDGLWGATFVFDSAFDEV